MDGRRVDQGRVGDLVSFVPSEHFLFAGSIYENLTLGDAGLSEKACQDMADAIGIGDWLRSLPGRLDYGVETGGANFSGGQRQMLCVLRALLFRRPILILDEPFSALDAEHEGKLRDALLSIKEDRVVLLTSHRNQSLGFCDHVLQL